MCEPISCCILIGCWYMYKKDKEKKALAGNGPRPVSIPSGGLKTATAPRGMTQTGGGWRGIGGHNQQNHGGGYYYTGGGDSGGYSGGDAGGYGGDDGGDGGDGGGGGGDGGGGDGGGGDGG